MKKKQPRRRAAKKGLRQQSRYLGEALTPVHVKIKELGNLRWGAPTVYGGGEISWSDEVREGFFAGQPCKYCVIDGLAITEGDIVLGTAAQMAGYLEALEAPRRPGVQYSIISMGPGGRWPKGEVFYEIDPGLPNPQRITDAMAFFSRETSIKFYPRLLQPDYICFTPAERCNSPIGRQGGMQLIRLDPDCGAGSVAHEICHALGILHEQQRSDRASFVTIHWENIKEENKFNFEPSPLQPLDVRGYDYRSIMHYPRFAFSDNNLPTITPIPNRFQDIGQRGKLSDGDIHSINDLYPGPALLESSDRGPAIATMDQDDNREEILLAWKGNGNDNISTMTSFGGLNFYNKTTLNERTSNAPAVCVLGDRYFLAWTGVGNNKINIMSSSNGRDWGSKVTLNQTSPSAPALAACGAEVFLAWQGGDERLNVIRSPDGRNWSPKKTLSERSLSGPALGSIGGVTLLLAWRGKGNNLLNVMKAGFFGWLPGTKVTLGETTDDHPALCRKGNDAVLTWQGTGNHRINVIRSSDGLSWSGKQTFSETSGGGPACTPFQHTFVRAWTDSASGNALRATFFAPP